ncbi:YggS family pyridoxal phosphate-dependent enzyme [Tenacibaculum sp. S7007]|uniref:Pyridoxal phosphate homeostasis protein n=1 Tax=Tenacibaculum pelagium TaxID=2759527 RepID=A0A839AN01_9FLAO|nr:YggS family pyridoxal phosphate-dependent enzyme [Tenacibaculum pelagium]MBA6156463.1 YggS family pyridoxal phosphate-dependent enzyme [Tenacibaculum pelagium]
MPQTTLDNLKVIQQRIENACRKANREANEVKLLLATKTVDANRIKTVIEKGETLIGENKIQEIKQKYDNLKNISHQKHFIGHLQSNKIKEILKYDISCIQSLDRISLAEKLQKRLETEDKTINAFIQVNTSAEESKFGIPPNEAINLAKEFASFDRIYIKGLMTIGLFSAEAEKVRACFKLLRSIQQEIIAQNIPNIEMKELSMGMSSDLEIAIEEGATIIRIGTAIFGERIYPDSYYWNEKNTIR